MKFLKKKIRRKGLILGLIVIFVFTFCMNSTIIVNATLQKGEKAYVKVKRNLNMREAPKLNAKIIEKLSPGEIVTILSIEDEKWVQVETSNKEIGFVCMDYLVIPEVDVDEYELLSVAVITKTGGSSANRNFNMAKAAEAIDGVVLDPEEEFAWYSTENTEGIVGPASKENGYKEAPVIIGKRSVLGYGGGVCQVSTALYNCIYKIGIEPTEHHHHSLASSYVKKGMDATVTYPSKNFVFTNTEEYSIMFEVYTDGPQVVVVAYKVLD